MEIGEIITNSRSNYSYISSFAPSVSTNVGLHFATQSNGNGEVRMTIDNVGNVGIGTDYPDYKLHIEGSFVDNDKCNIKLKNTASNTMMYFQKNDDGKCYLFNAGSENLYIGTENNYSNQLVLKAGGNIGIGTDNPGSKLEIKGGNTGPDVADLIIKNSDSATVRIEDVTADNQSILHFKTTSFDWAIGLHGATTEGNFKISNHSQLGTNDYLTINRSGNTIINGRLDVNAICDNSTASAGVNHVKFKNTEMINSNYLGLDTAQEGTLAYDANYNTPNEAGSADLNSETYLDTDRVISGYNNTENTGGMMLRDKDGWTMIPSSRTLKYLHTRLCSLGVGVTPPGTEGELLVNGNVGIGTSNPDYKLHIEGSFTNNDSCNIKIKNTASNNFMYIQKMMTVNVIF